MLKVVCIFTINLLMPMKLKYKPSPTCNPSQTESQWAKYKKILVRFSVNVETNCHPFSCTDIACPLSVLLPKKEINYNLLQYP